MHPAAEQVGRPVAGVVRHASGGGHSPVWRPGAVAAVVLVPAAVAVATAAATTAAWRTGGGDGVARVAHTYRHGGTTLLAPAMTSLTHILSPHLPPRKADTLLCRHAAAHILILHPSCARRRLPEERRTRHLAHAGKQSHPPRRPVCAATAASRASIYPRSGAAAKDTAAEDGAGIINNCYGALVGGSHHRQPTSSFGTRRWQPAL